MPTFYLDYENGNNSNDGTSWVNAWKTINGGATGSRVAPGDVIRIAKSPAPYTIGSGSWTNLSKTVTLASASQTANIDMCETAWTPNGSGDTTVTRQGTTWKEGTYAMTLTLDSSPQTNTMQAYYTIPETNFSSFQKISFWIRNSAAIVDGNWKVTLCSDTGGTTVVDTFAIPPIPSTARFLPLTLPRIGGGNSGSSIQSIAITTGSAAPTASSSIIVDDFIACTTNGLNLQSLISKNSAEQGGTEPWHGIQSINGSTILLDNETSTLQSGGRGYYGTSGSSVITYARETIKTGMVAASTTTIQSVQDSGTAVSNIEFQGGYDTGTSLQTGETFFDCLNGYGVGILVINDDYITFNRINFIRNWIGIEFNASYGNTIKNMFCGNNTYSLYLQSTFHNVFETIYSYNGNTGIIFSTLEASSKNKFITPYNLNNFADGINFGIGIENYFSSLVSKNNGYYGINFDESDRNTIYNYTSSNNGYQSISQLVGKNYIINTDISETAVYTATSMRNGYTCIENYLGYSKIFNNSGNAVTQVATGGGTGLEWKVSITQSIMNSLYPFILDLTQIAVIANSQVTVTCYFKKSHATDIGAKLICPADQLAGVNETYTTCPENTNRNQLQIQFTPTESGVLRVEARIYWVANTADEYVLIDDISVSQG